MSDSKQPVGKKRETLLNQIVIPVDGWTPSEFRDAAGVHAEALRKTFNADNKMAVQSYAKFLQRMVRDGRLRKSGRKYVRDDASRSSECMRVSSGECLSPVPQMLRTTGALDALPAQSPRSTPPVIRSGLALVSPRVSSSSSAPSSLGPTGGPSASAPPVPFPTVKRRAKRAKLSASTSASAKSSSVWPGGLVTRSVSKYALIVKR